MTNNTRAAAHTDTAPPPTEDPGSVEANTSPTSEPAASATAVEASLPTHVDQPTGSEKHQSIAAEFVALKHSTQELARLFKRMSTAVAEGEQKIEKATKLIESLGVFLVENEHLSAEDATVEPFKKTIHEPTATGPSKAQQSRQTTRISSGRGGRRFYPKPYYPRKPNWVLKVLEPFGLEDVQALDQMELQETTLKCLAADGVEEAGYIEKRALKNVISGCDAILQIRDNRLENYAAYTLVDLLDHATPEVESVIVMNRLGAMSSKAFLKSVQRHIETANLKLSQHILPENVETDLEHLAKNTPNRPRLFICTPEMLEQLHTKCVIAPKAVQVMILFEAEHVLKVPSHVQIIKTTLDTMENCQVVLACHVATEDVLLSQDAFAFDAEKVIFSMDHATIHTARHYYYTDKSMTAALMTKAVDMSKKHTVVVICHGGSEAQTLKEQLSSRTHVYTAADLATTTGVISGLLLRANNESIMLSAKPHAGARMVLNLSSTALTPERYLGMLASTMDLGEPCEVVTKVESRAALEEIEALGWASSNNHHPLAPFDTFDTTGHGTPTSCPSQESYQRVGQTISDNQMEQLRSQMDTFRTNLETFARLHRKDIQKDPEFRMHFQKMCGNIGVDPLASSKGYWGELLGVGDFYYELGIQIIDVCLSTRALNGGLMELSEVKRRVERMRGLRDNNNSNNKSNSTSTLNSSTNISTSKWSLPTSKDASMAITEDDVLRSIKTLAPLGSGFQVLQIGDKKMVSSVPRELNRDQSVILGLVQKTNGHVNVNVVVERLGWESGRIKAALDTLLEDSLMWIDKQAEPYEYWVPGFFEPEDDDIYATAPSA
ncbi:hypothetical protein KVV02_007927 [Mortierella alpina]|uniref:Uncharacterized protein n=1 Tax=Mortierella alpina TaxID=64518 RepID=A0A9P8D177_MORAP|nr:hypothetical protein KVV02_007927 [Mortierella alpina]